MFGKIFKGIGKAIGNFAKTFIGGPVVHVASAVYDLVTQDEDLAEDYQDFQMAQMKLQYVQHQDNIKLQTQLAQINHEKAKEIQQYIQSAENARLEKKLEFEKWRFQEEKSLQLQVLELNHRLQTRVLSYQRQTSLKVLEEQKKLDNSPIWLVTSDIITNNNQGKITPLRIFFAPPKLQFERLQNNNNFSDNLPNLELTIAEGLRQFLQHYTSGERQIDFLAGAWTSKSFHSEASIKSLFSVLKSEPTLVLESEIDGNYLNFRIAQWFKNGANYNYRPIISRLSYQEILFNSAKERALKWLELRNKLIKLGENEAEIDQVYGGDNVQNLATFKKEVKFKEAGIDDFKISYLVNNEDYENLAQFLIIYHCIFTGLVADEYFLREYQLTPLLPSLIPDLIKDIKEDEFLTEIIDSVKVYYDQLYDSLAEIYGVFLPDLILDFALNLAHISQPDWAKSQVINSLKLWLKQRHFLGNEVNIDVSINGLLSMVEDNIISGDQGYIDKLNQCLVKLDFGGIVKLDFVEGELVEELEINLDITEVTISNSPVVKTQSPEELEKNQIKQYLTSLNISKQQEFKPPKYIEYDLKGRPLYKYESIGLAISGDLNYFTVLFLAQYTMEKQGECLANIYQTIYNFNSEKQVQNISFLKSLKSPSAFDNIKQQIQPVIINPNFTDMFIVSHTEYTYFNAGIPNKKYTYIYNIYKKKAEYFNLLHKFSIGKCSSLNISKNNLFLVMGTTDGFIELYQIRPDNKDKLIFISDTKLHYSKVNSVVFSPNSDILVSSGDNTIKIHQVEPFATIATIFHDYNSCKSLIFSPDSKTLFGVKEYLIIQWDINTKQEIRTFSDHKSNIITIAIHPEGKILACSYEDKTVKFWYIPTGEEIHSINEEVRVMSFSSDGQTFATLNNNTAKLWRSPMVG